MYRVVILIYRITPLAGQWVVLYIIISYRCPTNLVLLQIDDAYTEINYLCNITKPASNVPNMLRCMNKCENGWSNFSASFRVVALKWTELIRYPLPTQWFSSISYVPLLAKWRHHEQLLSLCCACIYFPFGTKAVYSPGLGEQSGVIKESIIKVYLGFRIIDSILKLLNKKVN